MSLEKGREKGIERVKLFALLFLLLPSWIDGTRVYPDGKRGIHEGADDRNRSVGNGLVRRCVADEAKQHNPRNPTAVARQQEINRGMYYMFIPGNHIFAKELCKTYPYASSNAHNNCPL